jgi:hypothetical protein
MTNARKRPAPPQDRPSSTSSNRRPDPTVVPGYQRSEAPTADDRADAAVLEAASQRGFRLAVRCTVCGHWLTAPKSVRRFVGPHCHHKAVSA